MTTLLAIIYVIFISLGLPDSLFGTAWPVAHLDFGIQESFASTYSIITGICSGGTSVFAGTLIRKLGTGKVAFLSTLLTVIGMLTMAVAPNIFVMMLGAIILGNGAGAIDTGLNNFISLHYEAKHLNWLHCFWGLGVTVSPIIMSFTLASTGSWRGSYKIIAAIQLIIAVIILFSLPKWKKAESKVRQELVHEEAPKKVKALDLIKTKGLITSILSMGTYCGMEFTLGTWGATYAVNTFALPPDEAAKWVSLYYGGIMIGRVISGFVSMKFSDNALIRSGIIVTLLGMTVLALPIGKISLLSFLLIGIGMGPIFPSILHSVPSRFGTKFSADLTGLHLGGAYGIGFAIQLTYGYTATATTFKITSFVLLTLAIITFIANEATIKKTATQK